MRIERLWVDVTVQIGSTWAEIFIDLELHHGLNINSSAHIWLLHHLFLPIINDQLAFFADSWNQHRLQIRNGPNRSPADMFGFDMYVHGVRGDQLPPEDELSPEDLEVFGVDWEGLRDDRVLGSLQQNNSSNEEASSWIGRVGPPENLGGVHLDAPEGPLSQTEVEAFDTQFNSWMEGREAIDAASMWGHGLIIGRNMFGNRF